MCFKLCNLRVLNRPFNLAVENKLDYLANYRIFSQFFEIKRYLCLIIKYKPFFKVKAVRRQFWDKNQYSTLRISIRKYRELFKFGQLRKIHSILNIRQAQFDFQLQLESLGHYHIEKGKSKNVCLSWKTKNAFYSSKQCSWIAWINQLRYCKKLLGLQNIEYNSVCRCEDKMDFRSWRNRIELDKIRVFISRNHVHVLNDWIFLILRLTLWMVFEVHGTKALFYLEKLITFFT